MNLKGRVEKLEQRRIDNEQPKPEKVFILPDNGEYDAWRQENPDEFCVLVVRKCMSGCPDPPETCPDYGEKIGCKFNQADTGHHNNRPDAAKE